jgi:DNA-binding XRE family transcriptional regulator
MPGKSLNFAGKIVCMATKNELETKKELARMYYMQGETQKDIAGRLSVSEQTVGKWAEKDNWAARRAGINITRPELVNKALVALNMILDQVLESKDIEVIAALPDKLSKFAASIEKLDRKSSVVNYMEAFTAFLKWLRSRVAVDGELSSDLIIAFAKYQDIFINEHINL